MKGKRELVEILQKLNITYRKYVHPPLNSVSDSELYAKHINVLHCKNLLLKDMTGKIYLAIIPAHKKVDLKELSNKIKSKRLSFVSSTILETSLGVKPGCVTPFALMNDLEKQIMVIIDQDILREKETCFHPMINTETYVIEVSDLLKYIDYCGQHRKNCEI